MGIRLTREAEEACQGSALGTPARFILCQLAGKARDATRLAWPAHSTLASVTGLSERAVRKCVGSLECDGRISVWRRSGKVPLYLVHPHGLAALLPFDRAELLSHLREGHFSAGERESALAWRARLQAPIAPNVVPLDPGTRFRGGDGTPAPNATLPGTRFRGTPAQGSTESEWNQKGTGKPDLRLALSGEPAEDRASKAATPAPAPPPPPSPIDFAAPAAEVLDRLRGEDSSRGRRARELPDADALRMVEELQGTMRRHKAAAE